jgi:small subunit ribosomal protein S21
VQVIVRDNKVDQALKKKMQREGNFREMKLRNDYEKPSEKKVRERSRQWCAAPAGAQRERLIPSKRR